MSSLYIIRYAIQEPQNSKWVPSLLFAVAVTPSIGAGNLGSVIDRMAVPSKYNPEQNELTHVVVYNLKSYHG